jgi:hypothetical protein
LYRKTETIVLYNIMNKKNSLSIPFLILLWSSCTYDHLNVPSSKCANTTVALSVTITDASTCGASDGSIVFSASGGVREYTYSINGGSYLSDTVYSNLKAGNYTIIAKDANGCSGTKIASVNNGQSTLTASAAATANTGCPNANGTITITASGGTAPIQYKLNSGSYQTTNTFSGLTAGTYSITVTDAGGCTASTSTAVASGGPSFSLQISPIIASYCATSGCHNGSRNPNLTTYAAISANGSSIVSAINRNMPPGQLLTSTQIAQITCWVKDGTPNN